MSLFIQDAEVRYTLAEFGNALLTIDIFTGECCQVDVKEFSPFEVEVYSFLIANDRGNHA